MHAPVLPAETTPSHSPSRCKRHATRMEESFLARNAFAAESSMVTTSVALRISIGRRDAVGWQLSSRRRTSSWPTRMTFTPSVDAARIAPSTSDLGARSPPMASTAMVVIGSRSSLLFGDLDYFPALVFSAMRAYAVRDLGLVAARTLRQNRSAERIVRAARRSAAFGMTSFWIRHGSSLT